MTAVFNRSSNETFLILWYIEIFEGLHLPGTTDGSYITPVIEIQCIYFQINATIQNASSYKSFRFLHVEIINWNCSLWNIKIHVVVLIFFRIYYSISRHSIAHNLLYMWKKTLSFTPVKKSLSNSATTTLWISSIFDEVLK